ncbi:MAG TPA: M12 family metallo-peptidase [Flavobacteriales bacterium]|nr:M12 family metallo-peptidase [Flavobacteriales bacterium]
MRTSRPTLLLLTLSLCFHAAAQHGRVSARIQELRTKGVPFATTRLFALPEGRQDDRVLDAALSKGELLLLDHVAMGRAVQQGGEHIALAIPFQGGMLELDLARTAIADDAVNVVLASGQRSVGIPGVHYRGMIRGVGGSWAAVSLFDGELMALVNDGQGQIVVGKLKDDAQGRHVIYRDRDLRGRPTFTCGTEDGDGVYHSDEITAVPGERTVRCVRYYWEVNHNIYLDKGDVANTTNYITGLFNQSAILFDNDGIDVTLSELFIWDVPSPYTGPGSGDFLDQFGVERTSFNGDMAHLLGYGGGGGVAWLNTLCSSQTRLRMAYSGINSTYNNVPTYSWSTMVVTHEAGHNLGSRHTHACSWNGNGTNIDGCGPTANSNYSEGSCPIGPVPTGVGGTIMSYCHLLGGVGINLSLGFGPQPTAVIVNAVNAASCLNTCGSTCDAPGTLSVTNLGINTATLSWSAVGVATFDLRWRAVGAPTWTEVNGISGNSYPLSGLTQGTTYEFQVRSVCDATTSAYSTVRTFTTQLPCPDAYEPNETQGTAAVIGTPVIINALIAANGDVDYYRFTLTATSTITVSLSTLPYDYDLRLLTAAGGVLATSTAGSTTSEYITYTNAAPGDYLVHVYGYNGAFDAQRCYTLIVSPVVTACPVPDAVTVNAVTYESASIGWATVQGAQSYDLRYKETAAVDWTDVTGLTSSPYLLESLNSETSYDVQVRAVCSAGGTQGGSTSDYSETISFITEVIPCEVQPRINCGLFVLLDGPYDTNTGMMHDSLRVHGLIPLQEPYTALGYPVEGITTTTQTILDEEGAGAIVDWVLLELREPDAPFALVETRAALVRRDGSVRSPTGNPFLPFCAEPGMYRVAVRHRNHLACMSGYALDFGPLPASLALTNATTYGTQAMRDRNGVSLMWAGNVVDDGQVMYSGLGNDRDVILFAIGGTIPTNTVSGYRVEDVNLDGVVKYSGAGSDRDVILNSIGGVIPTNTVQEQMP